MALKLSSIKNLFIVEEENDKKPETKETSKTTETTSENTTTKTTETEPKLTWQTSASNTTTSNTTTSNTVSSGSFNQKILDSLSKAIFDSNLPGEDYLEFMEAFKAMKDIPLEESIKMKTAYATLSTRGLTIPKILESAEYYLKILESEKNKFYSALEGQKQGNIGGKKKLMTDKDAENKTKAEQIKKLTEEINSNTIEIEKISKEISEFENKIKSTENDFIYTFEKMSNQIKENVEKIKTING
jgi:hypothetical protein